MADFAVSAFRLTGPNTPPFNICHYLSIKSFLKRMGDYEYHLYIDQEPLYSSWYLRLRLEYPKRFKVKLVKDHFTQEVLDKAYSLANLAHTADYLRLILLRDSNAGIFTDLDMICIHNPMNLFRMLDQWKPIYVSELDRDNLMEALPNGLVIKMNPNVGAKWFAKLLSFYEDYNPNSWSETGITRPTQLFKEDKSQINLISGAMFDPIKYYKLDIRDIFLHRRDVSRCFMLHISESASSAIMGLVDLEYIMTQDTTLASISKDLVFEFWDEENKRSQIGEYE